MKKINLGFLTLLSLSTFTTYGQTTVTKEQKKLLSVSTRKKTIMAMFQKNLGSGRSWLYGSEEFGDP